MSQQPSMSSFSTLEFHAGHHKGAAASRGCGCGCRGGCRVAVAIFVNRFITSRGPRRRVSPGVFETIVVLLFSRGRNATGTTTRGDEIKSAQAEYAERRNLSLPHVAAINSRVRSHRLVSRVCAQSCVASVAEGILGAESRSLPHWE